MPRWLGNVLPKVRELADLDLGLDEDDCCDVLKELTATDSAGRIRSTITGEWTYVFKPRVTGTRLYVKLILRGNCILISFHEEGNEDGNQSSAER